MITENTRTIKELLTIMLNNQNLFKDGLCIWASILCLNEIITPKERLVLKEYINNNRPNFYESKKAFVGYVSLSPYYWDMNDINPRLKWIEKHIELNK
jgi:hypothetical protein